MGKGKCPKCGSSNIDQYRMMYGPMWCTDCGFLVEDKNAAPNPFLKSMDESTVEKSPKKKKVK